MKKVYIVIGLMFIIGINVAQTLKKNLDSFEKIVISEFIDVELKKGTEEKIEFIYDERQTNSEDLITKIKGNTLLVYLEGHQMNLKTIINSDKHHWNNKKIPKVKAVITYKTLSKIKMYGEETLVCEDEVSSKRMKLKLYGEMDVKIASVKCNRLKIALYGDNKLKIDSGKAWSQKINSYGDNKVFVEGLKGSHLKSTSLGEGQMHFGKHDHIKVISLGETLMTYSGNPQINKPIILGESKIKSRK
jgi:hypothetical protein